MRPKAQHLAIGRFGWRLWFPGYEEHNVRYLDYVLTGYRETWTDCVAEMADDILGTDTRTVPDHEIYTWSWHGPMCQPDLPGGMISRVGEPLAPWRDTPLEDHDPRLGNARGLDEVALDVYVTLLRRFGGRTFDPREEHTA